MVKCSPTRILGGPGAESSAQEEVKTGKFTRTKAGEFHCFTACSFVLVNLSVLTSNGPPATAARLGDEAEFESQSKPIVLSLHVLQTKNTFGRVNTFVHLPLQLAYNTDIMMNYSTIRLYCHQS